MEVDDDFESGRSCRTFPIIVSADPFPLTGSDPILEVRREIEQDLRAMLDARLPPLVGTPVAGPSGVSRESLPSRKFAVKPQVDAPSPR